ncbi:hypothetical protein FSP39_019449 [Pinctada imbricata]|uniref:Uncharacterized protein n=1 Tax=Pinctada imbricata TaxID=66713 RepID=A0AA88XGR2_PINIB|nr:hypothetical protein FSP39_019449 [Pinctada imbricata]
MSKQFVCRCFYTDNYFLKQYNMHFVYNDDDDFLQRYGKIKQEKNRRENISREYLKRKAVILRRYERLHPEIFTLKVHFLDPRFLKLVEVCKSQARCREDVLSHIKSEDANEAYSFPVFTTEFCEKLMAEISNFEESDCPKGRPNTMNHYGVLLNELGFDDDFLDPLREDYPTSHHQASISTLWWGWSGLS